MIISLDVLLKPFLKHFHYLLYLLRYYHYSYNFFYIIINIGDNENTLKRVLVEHLKIL